MPKVKIGKNRVIEIKRLDQFCQLLDKPTPDGYLVSKIDRDFLVNEGLATRCEGYNLLTRKGHQVAHALGIFTLYEDLGNVEE